jgi:hypothetical protein
MEVVSADRLKPYLGAERPTTETATKQWKTAAETILAAAW